MKHYLRSAVERVLARVPLARAAYLQRDRALAENAEVRAALARAGAPPTKPAAGPAPLGSAAQVRQLDPHHLETQVPLSRSIEERIAIAMRCRDADVLAKVADAGAVVEEADGTRVQIMHNGIRVVAGGYYGAWMQDLITRCRGHHEPQEEVLFAEVLRHLPPGATMLELGGFWSFYSIWFLTSGRFLTSGGSLTTGPGRRSVVLEADPAHLDIGRANARLNRCSPVFLNAIAGGRAAPSAPFATEVSGVLNLPCMTVQSVMDEQSIRRLDLLHCDAQGAEFDVLSSCADLAASGRLGWVVVSTHTHQISNDPLTHQRCLAVLRQLGATVLAEHDVQESFSGDGLIVGKFGAVPEGWRMPALSYNRYSESLFRNPLYDLAALQTR